MENQMKEIMDKVVQDVLTDEEQEEIDYLVSLDEMATVGRSQREKLLIQVNPGESQAGNAPYFKVYDSANEANAEHMARIRFDYPLYEIHARKYNRGKEYWWLNSREKRKLINYLNAPNMYNNAFTNWQHAIIAFNAERGLNPEQTQENLLANRQLTHPGFMPFDLPMPNYMLLAPPPDGSKLNERIAHQIEGKPLAEAERIAKKILDSLRS